MLELLFLYGKIVTISINFPSLSKREFVENIWVGQILDFCSLFQGLSFSCQLGYLICCNLIYIVGKLFIIVPCLLWKER